MKRTRSSDERPDVPMRSRKFRLNIEDQKRGEPRGIPNPTRSCPDFMKSLHNYGHLGAVKNRFSKFHANFHNGFDLC